MVAWLQGILEHSRKCGADTLNVNNALVCKFHFNPSDRKKKKEKAFQTYHCSKFSGN